MGRELQKKKRRSSIAKVTVRRNARIHKINLGNPIIKANWFVEELNPRLEVAMGNGIANELVMLLDRDKNLTLSQNYKRLGLTARLGASSGGVDKNLPNTQDSKSAESTKPKKHNPDLDLAPGEARIERDEAGKVIRVVYGKSAEERLNALSDNEDEGEGEEGVVEEWSGFKGEETAKNVIRALEEVASRGVKVERKQSAREQDWVERLVGKYGDDYRKMARDMKLNPYQQSEGDIKKRVMKWRSKNSK